MTAFRLPLVRRRRRRRRRRILFRSRIFLPERRRVHDDDLVCMKLLFTWENIIYMGHYYVHRIGLEKRVITLYVGNYSLHGKLLFTPLPERRRAHDDRLECGKVLFT
jgi:hypothetical protein